MEVSKKKLKSNIRWPNILEPNILIVTCRDCNKHNWMSRHDEQKYLSTALELKDYL